MKDFQYITSSHPSYIENLYNDFVKDPNTVDADLRKFFEGFDSAVTNGRSASVKNGNALAPASVSITNLDKEFAVYRLIAAYRKKGHLIAHTNPIRERKDRHANLGLENFGLTETDLNTGFEAGKFIGLGKATLSAILEKLNKIYTGHVGIEISSLNNEQKVNWLTEAMEIKFAEVPSLDQRKHILEKLNEAVMFEKFLHTKFIGQKRFSLEGGETTIPALDAIIQTASEHGAEEVVLGMAHRGRLNVLANIMGKTYENIFNEFEGTVPSDTTMGSGDVKYHLGYSSELEMKEGKKLHLKLAPNPSHLEAVNPVVLGFTRSKADILYDKNYQKILPILIHGDASLAGQGIVYEIAQARGKA